MELEHGSGRNKCLETRADESGSSKHSEISLRAFDGSGSRSSFEKHLDSVDGIEATDNSGSIRRQDTQLDVVDESGSNEKLENLDGRDRIESSTIRVSSSLSSSSSSLSSSSDSSIDHSHDEFTKSAEHDSGAKPTTKDDESSVASGSSSKSEDDDTNPADSELTFQVSDVTHESPVHRMVSPPVQTMEQPEGYDPLRIPSSVFESKSTTPMEWSVASNESLFSLHVGNSSFSKDQFYMFSDFKSGELAKSGEIVIFSPPPTPSPSIPEAEIEINSLETKESAGAKELTENPIKDEARQSAEGSSAKRVPRPAVSSNSSGHSHRSEESETSARSFAFPIKKKKNLQGVLKSESMRPENEKLHSEVVLAAKKASKSTTAYNWFLAENCIVEIENWEFVKNRMLQLLAVIL
ncbi:suppressor protein SRP40 [Morus notabilis]|uniref:suppressor protein SRP40 n=1 Tax=Morus notabilis TaxID=981085 RepID=UPI000CECFF46|nr:suppressor protein SRP40 [Morus notabilis]